MIIRLHAAVRVARAWIPALALILVLGTCSRDALGPSRAFRTPLGSVSSNPPEILVGAGDIAMCNDTHDEATATLLDGIAGTVFVAGDNAYQDGTLTQYQDCYGPSWGRHKARTRPVPGNHEYNTPNAAGYFDYFGAAAGVAGKGFYSYDLGDWHIVALNNYISMEAGSEQETWLSADLAATTQPCRLAIYHEPLYSSATGTGSGGTSTLAVRPLFTTLYNAGVDVVLNAHRHFYERLAPMNPQGEFDNDRGIRHFIVGTGGSGMADPTNAFPLSELRFGSGNHGVLKLYLYSDSYAWRFVPEAGKTLSDSGSYACHGFRSGVSASQSTVTAVPTTIPVGGTATVAATVRDGSGQPLPGVTVQFAVSPADGSTLTQPAGPTGTNGVATGTLSATALGARTVSATATLAGQTTPLNQTATVLVAAPSVVTQTLLTAGNSPVNQKVYTTAAIAPAANALVTVAVLGRNATAASPSPVLTGGGMTTWTEVASATFDPIGTPKRRVTIYRAMSASPGSGPLTITFTATQGNAQWIVSQWSGVDLTGENGAGAIVQSGTMRADAVTGLTVALGAFANANNVAYGAFGVTRNTAVVTPGAGFTEISEQPSGESTTGDLQAEWRINDNTIDATWGTLSLNAAAVGVEIKSASSGAGSTGVDALQSSLEAAPTSIAAGGGTATITVTARDASGLPVSGAIVELAATGAGNTLTQPGPTNADGVATGTLTSTVMETKTLSAIANGVALSDLAAVTVTAGPVSATRSTVAAAPTSIAPGGQTSTISVTVKDAYDNPVNNAAVTLAASPLAGVTLTQPSATDASGVATGDVSSAVAEDKTVSATVTVGGVTTAISQTVTVTVTPQGTSAIGHTLLAAGNNAVNQKVYTTASIAPAANALVTVAVLGRFASGASPSPVLTGGGMTTWTEVTSATFDPIGAPTRRVTIYRAMSASPGSGPLTITFTGTQGNAQWIVSQWSGVETSGVNGSGAVVQAGSTRADAVTGLNVLLSSFGHANNVAYGAFGVNRNAAVVTPGAGFTEIAEQPSGESTPGDLQAEWRTNDNTIDASWVFNLNAAAVGVEIRAAASGSGFAVDPDQTTLDASPTSITPGGAGSTIEVTVRDAGGAPLSGVVVELFATGTGNTLSAPGPTDLAGVYQGTLSSTKAETKIVTATARLGTVTTTLNATTVVTVEPGPVSATQSSVSAEPTSIPAGSGNATITVTVTDAQQNPISGATVTLAATGTGNTLSAPGTTNASGVYTGTLSSTVAEDKAVSAAAIVDGVATAIAQTATVTVTGLGVSATQSTLSADPPTILAGSGSATITVTVKNGGGEPISGATVELFATGMGNTLAAPGLTDASGVYTGTLSSTVAGEKVVSANATVGTETTALTATATVTVEPGPVSTTQSLLTAVPGTIGAGTGSSTITVTVKDAQDNPIPGATVELFATGTGNTLAAPGLTDANGVFTGTLSSTVTGEKVVSASATVGTATTALTATATVTVEPAPVSATQSTVGAAPGTITVRSGSSTITVTVRDAQDNPVPGATVDLFATGTGNTLAAPGLTDASGVYTGSLSSTVVGEKVVSATATVGAVTTPITAITTVAVESGVSETQSTVGAAPGAIEAGTGSATITVTVRDANGDPLGGAAVALAATGAGNTLSAPGLTDASGVYTGSLSSTGAGEKTVSATADGTSITQTALVTVTAGAVDAAQSTVVAAPTSIAQGGPVATITVTAKDALGNLVAGAAVELTATGSGNTLSAPGLTDAGGVYTGTLSSAVAGEKVVSATANGTSITQAAPVTVLQAFSAALSTVAAAPGTIEAGTGSSTITVTVKDANGDPISGAAVALAATGAGNTLSAPGLTDASGVYTGTLSSTGAEEKTVSATVEGVSIVQTAIVAVVEAGAISATHSTVAAVPSAIEAGTGSAIITVTVKDALGNPISGAGVELVATGDGNTLTQPVGLTDVNGVATGALSSTVAAEKTVSATANGTGITQTALVTVTAGAVDAAQSAVVATPTSIAQGGPVATITVTAKDALGNLVAGAAVELTATGSGNTLSAPGVTDAGGVYTGTLSSTVAGEKVVSATANGTSVTQTAAVTVLPVFSAALSTVAAAPGTIEAGSATSTITVTVKDTNGDPISGAAVALAATGSGNTLAAPGLTDASGVYTGTLSSTVAAEKTVSATADGTSITQTALVTVTAGAVDAAQSTVVATPTSIAQGGPVATITVTAKDASGNPVAGTTVELEATGAGNSLTQPIGLTDENGVATGTLSSAVAGEKMVSATAGGTPLTQTAPVTVLQVFSPSLSTVAAASGTIEAGTGSSTITVTVRDANGDPISGAAVELAATGAGNTLSAPGVTDASGAYTGSLSSTVAGEKSVSATADGAGITQTALVTVTAGAVDAGQSTVVAAPTTIAQGGAAATITVTVKDAQDNPVSGATVELFATGTGNTLAAPGLTDANGVYTGTLSSTVAEEKVVSATATVGATTTALTPTATVTVTPLVAHTLLMAGGNAANQRVYTTAAIAPAPNTLVVVAVLGRMPTGASPSPALSGGGMTSWTEVATVTFDPIGAPTRRLTIYRAMSAAPGSGPLTITFAASQGNAQWIVSQWDGVDLTGVNGAGAIVQTGASQGDAVSGLTVPLAVFGHANNVAYGAFGVTSNALAVTPGAGFTEISEQPSGESTPGDLQAQWAANLNNITASWANLSAGALGLEIKARALGVPLSAGRAP